MAVLIAAPSSFPLVSVILPVLNPHPLFFPQAIASMLSQTHNHWELLVVEDPSETSAASMLPSDPRIRYVRNDRRTSFADQLNQGFKLARGEYIARFDADDVCVPDRLEKQLLYLREHSEIDLVGSQLQVIDFENRILGYRVYPLEHAKIIAALRRYSALAHPAVMFRRRSLPWADVYRPSPYPGTEDYELWCRAASFGLRFANHPEALIKYRIHRDGMKTAQLRTLLKGTQAIKRAYWCGRMNAGDRVRALGEKILLWAPPQLVLWLFIKTQYKSSLPRT